MFKNIVNAVSNFVENKKAEIQEQIEAAKNIQKALQNPDNFKVDEVELTNVILEEAAKCQTRVHGFKFVVGTKDDLTHRMPVFVGRTNSALLEKIGFLGKFRKVELFVGQVAVEATKSVMKALMGETMTKELDGEDTVIVYPEQIKALWYNCAKRGETIQEIARQIVRHEFRHAEQFTELRKAGYDVKKIMDLECKKQYMNRIIERDAWAEEHLTSYRPISEFMVEIEAEYSK